MQVYCYLWKGNCNRGDIRITCSLDIGWLIEKLVMWTISTFIILLGLISSPKFLASQKIPYSQISIFPGSFNQSLCLKWSYNISSLKFENSSLDIFLFELLLSPSYSFWIIWQQVWVSNIMIEHTQLKKLKFTTLFELPKSIAFDFDFDWRI